MRAATRLSFSCFLFLAGVAPAFAQGKASDYLAKDGKLTGTLEVRDVQGGFAGFTGRAWRIEPSGKWTISGVMNETLEAQAKGNLSKEQLAALARDLARYDLKALPSKGPKRPMANPHVVTVKFGGKERTLTLNAGEELPGPGRGVEGRYAGIVRAVQGVTMERDRPK
jgi:hypothetical protein